MLEDFNQNTTDLVTNWKGSCRNAVHFFELLLIILILDDSKLIKCLKKDIKALPANIAQPTNVLPNYKATNKKQKIKDVSLYKEAEPQITVKL